MKKITAVCVYCGDLATCQDHIVPYLYSGTSAKRRGGVDPGHTVPSCYTCNNALGSKLFKTWEERCHFIWEWRSSRGLPIFNQRTFAKGAKKCDSCGQQFNKFVEYRGYCAKSVGKKECQEIVLIVVSTFIASRNDRKYCTAKCRDTKGHSDLRGFRRAVLSETEISATATASYAHGSLEQTAEHV